jgi:tRNA(Ile)-lysidine synthase TilS/MesJ
MAAMEVMEVMEVGEATITLETVVRFRIRIASIPVEMAHGSVKFSALSTTTKEMRTATMSLTAKSFIAPTILTAGHFSDMTDTVILALDA